MDGDIFPSDKELGCGCAVVIIAAMVLGWLLIPLALQAVQWVAAAIVTAGGGP